MDIEAVAVRNAAAWERRADEACARLAGVHHLRASRDSIRVGTNVDPGKLARFRMRTPPSVVSTYEVRAATEGPADAFSMTYASGSWGPCRRAFEEAIDGLRTAVYGTLDLPGCPGDDRYGPYRLVYQPAETAPPVVLPHNSALAYGTGGVADHARLEADAGAWEQRADVAVAELGEELAAASEPEWPLTLAGTRDNGVDLVEVVVRRGERRLEDVEVYRVSRDIFTAMLAGSGDALAVLAGSSAGVEAIVMLAANLAREHEDGSIVLEEVGFS